MRSEASAAPIDLNPNNPLARVQFGYSLLVPLGRFEEAAVEVLPVR
jgi:hypothetical protein